MKETVRERLLKTGAVAVGFAEAGEISPEADFQYKEWIGEGFNGEMAYLERHIPLRAHTDSVLPGARTVVTLAFSYVPETWRDLSLPTISAYAYGEDYHVVLRDILRPVVEDLKKEFGGGWRICIDSAPVAEKYWAVKSGVGIVGTNGALITEKAGSLCFLVEILTTVEFEPDGEAVGNCMNCNACIAVCPGRAIRGDGSIDARLCINYLTIEKKSEFTTREKELLKKYPAIRGCDRCLRVCPHNRSLPPTNISRFRRQPGEINAKKTGNQKN